MSTTSFLIFIITLLHINSAEDDQDLNLRSSPGLHTFTYYGSFADNISFGKLIVTINTKQIVRAVQKASATMDQKLNSPSPSLKLKGRRVMESVSPATARLKTMDTILYPANQSKRYLMGIAAMVAASHAIYDIQQLRGELGAVIH